MSNAARMFKILMAPGPALGTAIGAINIYNHKRSPIYKKDGSNDIRLAMGIGVKSVIYSTFWPIAATGIGISIYGTRKDFDSHFVPFSKYYRKGEFISKD